MNILLEASRRVAARVGGLPGRFWEEKGQTIFMVAVMLPLLLGAAAVVVDATNLFVNKRSVQNAADAAALAAARDLSTSACGSPCRVQVTKYARLNDAWSGVGDMPACASASDTNCVQNPYAGDPTKLEVRLRKSVPTLFGRIFGLSHDVNARAVSAIQPGDPPQLSWATLNEGPCSEHHTLVIRSSGILTVTNNIYVNSCNGTAGTKGDALDIFGTGGCIRAKDIFIYGGWETHTGLSVYIPVPGGNACGGAAPCPLLTAKSTTPYQPLCPHTGYPRLVDPFANKILPPALDPAGVPNTTCTVLDPCFFVNHFSPTCWLDRSIGGLATDKTVIAVAEGASGTHCPLVDPPAAGPYYYISIDGERMAVTNRGGSSGGALGSAYTLTVNRGQQSTVAEAHPQPEFTVVGERRSGQVATLKTSAPHNFNVGDIVRVNLTDNAFDGVWAVTDIPDFETAAAAGTGAVQFSYALTSSANLGVAGRRIVSARRDGGVATITLDGAWAVGEVSAGDPVIVDMSTGRTATTNVCPAGYGTCADDSFNERAEDLVTVQSVDPARKWFTYAQPALPDTVVTIREIGRFQDVTTVRTASAHTFANPDTGTIAYPPDPSFSGTFTVADVAADKITYPNPGADFGFTIASTKNLVTVARWHNIAWVATSGGLGGIKDTAPDNRIEINGVGSGYDGVSNVNLDSLADGNQTFSYNNTGADSALGPAINAAFAGRDAGGKVTLTTATAHGLAVGDVIVVSLGNTTFNNNGDAVVVTKINSATVIEYHIPVLGQSVNNATPATGDIKRLQTTAAPAGSTAKRRAAGQQSVNAAGEACDSTQPACTAKAWTDPTATGAFGFKTVSCLSTAFCAGGPLNEILSSTTTQTVSATSGKPVEYPVPGGVPHAPLNPGTYYGGLCIGNSPGKSCGVKVGGSCLTSSTMLNTTLTMNPGVYIMAGGGFHVCGNTTLIAKGVMIYNTKDSKPLDVGANAKAAELGQVKFNTNGEVFMTGVRTNPYKGMVIFQGTDPNPTPAAYDPLLNPYLQLSTAQCDNRNVNLTDIALIHMGTNGLGNLSIPDSGISGTIYAPAQHALFRDTVSGRNTLAIITGCIFIDGANSTFDYDSSPGGALAGFSTGLDE